MRYRRKDSWISTENRKRQSKNNQFLKLEGMWEEKEQIERQKVKRETESKERDQEHLNYWPGDSPIPQRQT